MIEIAKAIAMTVSKEALLAFNKIDRQYYAALDHEQEELLPQWYLAARLSDQADNAQIDVEDAAFDLHQRSV